MSMQLNDFTHKNYTTRGNFYQLKLPLNIDIMIPDDDFVRLLGQIAPVSKIIMARLTTLLAENKELSYKNLFIDGTKIEASANKYTFVWKKAVTKNQKKLLDKIPEFIQHVKDELGIRVMYKTEIRQYHLKKLRKRLCKRPKDEGVVFVHGVGKRKSSLQKVIEQLDKFLTRFKKYNQYLYIMGERNSFSKTDHDATFMRMKEDVMKNGQLKPAYFS
ncbi:MAG: hypothetical protein RR582_01430 [Niameybacter sp.]